MFHRKALRKKLKHLKFIIIKWLTYFVLYESSINLNLLLLRSFVEPTHIKYKLKINGVEKRHLQRDSRSPKHIVRSTTSCSGQGAWTKDQYSWETARGSPSWSREAQKVEWRYLWGARGLEVSNLFQITAKSKTSDSTDAANSHRSNR